MFTTTTYLFQNAAENSGRYGEEYRTSAAARQLYRRTREAARLGDLLARLFGRPRHLAALDKAVTPGHYAGLKSVPLNEIHGSLDRADDYDADWRPLDGNGEQRWLRVATARAEGRGLPPVQLVRAGGAYYVQDGHHRVSVARARGEREIEAEVTE
jgi:hypothetical protein